MKRKIALAFLAFLLLTVAGALYALSTPWAGRHLCDLAEREVRKAASVELSFGACRVRPLRLAVQVDDVRVGPADHPIFAADQVEARLAPLQALSRRLHLDEVSVVRPRVSVVLPPPTPGAPPAPCPPPFLQQFHVRRLQVDDGSLDLTLPGGEQVIVGRVDVHTTSEWLPTDLSALATGGRRSRVDVTLGPTLVEAGGRQTLLQQGFLDADFAFDLSRLGIRDFHVEGEGVKVSARGTVTDLCKPRLGLEVTAEAPLPAIFSLLRIRDWKTDGAALAKLRLSGPVESLDASADVQLQGARVGPYVPGDARVKARLRGTQVEVQSVEVPFSNGARITAKATIQLTPKPTVTAEAEVGHVEFAELLDRLGLDAARVMMKLDAKARVQGPLSPLRLTGDAVVDATDFRVLDRRWEQWKPGLATILDLPRGHVEAPVVVTADGVELREGARVTAGAETLGVQGWVFFEDAKGFQLALDGNADLTALRHVASVPFAGKASFRGNVGAQPYGPPHVDGTMQVRSFHFLQLDLGDVGGTVQATPDLVLRLRDGAGRKGESRYTVETAVDLGATPIRVLPSRAVAQGRMRDLFDVILPWLPATRLFQEAVDGSVQLEMPFEGPVPKVNMGFRASLGRGTLWGREFDWGRVEARVVDGERAVVDHAELHRGTAVATGGGTVDFGPATPWDLAVDVRGLDLSGLALPGEGWAGVARGSATFGRTVDDPLVRFQGTGEDVVAAGGVRLGLVEVSGELRGEDLVLNGTTPGIRLTGNVRLDGASRPYQATAEIDTEDLNRLFPGGPPAGLRAQARGRATARGTFQDFAGSEARLELSQLRVGYSDFRVENRDPVRLSVDRRRLRVESFTLQGTNTSFAVDGVREPSGLLDVRATGALDLRLLGGLVPAVVRTHGTLVLDAKIAGTLDEPVIVGSGRLADGGFRLRELPLEFAAMGGELVFSQNLVVFERLASTLNGAPVQLSGEVALSRFVPTRIRVEGDLDRVPVAIPSWLPTVLSGRLEAFGSPDSMTMAGTLHVVSARYTEPFDLEKRILQMGASRKMEARPYDPSQEWLAFDMRFLVDGDARIDNDLVRGQARGELTLTGTLAAFGMTGSLAFLPGGRAFYRGTEFVLSRAVVDFTDRTRIRMVLDVSGEAAVREYHIFLHLYGDLDDPKLQLSSTPNLTQQDIITLLSLGYTSRDTSVGGGIGTVATAAAAQALFTVSGLDQQLRRFVPQTGIFQDFTVRLTSAYSKTSMTVEPRWEFETKALDSRLRIRYQAPLSNSTRGQKAQVEYRLGDRASVQLQWDNDNIDVSGGDLGADFKLRWEWSD